MKNTDENIRPDNDDVVSKIAQYAKDDKDFSSLALETAHYCLFDSISCALLALKNEKCRKVLGPLFPGESFQNGARVIGTDYVLEPSQAAFNNTALFRWLDYNDTWLAAEWGHPSDNIGGILALCDYLNRSQGKDFTIEDVLKLVIKCYEIQGILALENAFNRSGIDHVVLVKIASCAVAAVILGGNEDQLYSAVTNSWADGGTLRAYRHAPNTGSRKSWAAGDAVRRAIQLATLSFKDDSIYPSVITAKTWGYQDALMRGKEITLKKDFDSYVMENILFKISFPAEFHAQTAVEAAIQIHPEVKDRLSEIDKIELISHESAIRIISKTGPLHNEADRDHCLQYMVAIGLIFGKLESKHYEDDVAKNPLIDEIREKMQVSENVEYTKDYLDLDKRSIANSIQVFFKDGTTSKKVEVEYPIGHRRRRKDGIPLLINKYKNALENSYSDSKSSKLFGLINNFEKTSDIKVDDFMSLFGKVEK